MTENCNVVGQTGEAVVAAQLAAAGFHVYAPIFCSPPSDLIGELDGRLVRFQVKTSTEAAPAIRFLACNSGSESYVGVVDYLAFYSAHHGVAAFFKPEEVGARPTVHYDEDGQQRDGVRYASDYSLDRVIKEILT